MNPSKEQIKNLSIVLSILTVSLACVGLLIRSLLPGYGDENEKNYDAGDVVLEQEIRDGDELDSSGDWMRQMEDGVPYTVELQFFDEAGNLLSPEQIEDAFYPEPENDQVVPNDGSDDTDVEDDFSETEEDLESVVTR